MSVVLFSNTPIRRHQKTNVTAEYGLLDVRPYFPGERPKMVGEKIFKGVNKMRWKPDLPIRKNIEKAFCINFKSNCINFKYDFIFILAMS